MLYSKLERETIKNPFGGGAEQRMVQYKGCACSARRIERLDDFTILERKGDELVPLVYPRFSIINERLGEYGLFSLVFPEGCPDAGIKQDGLVRKRKDNLVIVLVPENLHGDDGVFHEDLRRAEVLFLGILQEQLVCTRNKYKCRIESVHAGNVDLDPVRGFFDGKPGIVI